MPKVTQQMSDRTRHRAQLPCLHPHHIPLSSPAWCHYLMSCQTPWVQIPDLPQNQGKSSAHQDPASLSINEGNKGICIEEKPVPDPAPHVDLGHIEPSDSVVAPSWTRNLEAEIYAWHSSGPWPGVPPQPQRGPWDPTCRVGKHQASP